jgi:regulator of protease activity HflC (stomatin/prohibitin superfamily)
MTPEEQERRDAVLDAMGRDLGWVPALERELAIETAEAEVDQRDRLGYDPNDLDWIPTPSTYVAGDNEPTNDQERRALIARAEAERLERVAQRAATERAYRHAKAYGPKPRKIDLED